MAKKEEKKLNKINEGIELIAVGVKILQISNDSEGRVFGLGSDQKIYIWHHSLYYRENWVLHVSPEIVELNRKGRRSIGKK